MRVSTPLLYDLARGVDVDRIAPGERTLEVPPALFPYVCIPLAQAGTQVFNVLDRQRASFFQHATLIRTNQAESTVGFCTFGQGLWYLHLSLWYVANFSDFIVSGNGGRVLFGDSATALRNLLQVEPVANVVQVQDLELKVLMPDDGWLMQLNHFTTGVGETGHLKVALAAAKLL